MRIRPDALSQILKFADIAAKIVTKLHADHDYADRTGCVFGFGLEYTEVQERHAVPLIMLSPFGALSPHRFDICPGYVQEKNTRLILHPAHVSSWQSREEPVNETKKFGGAIRAPISDSNANALFANGEHLTDVNALLVASAYTEHGDEAVGILVSRFMGFAADETAITTASGNDLAKLALKLTFD